MEITAFGNATIMVACILVTAKRVTSGRDRRVLYTMQGTSLACSVAGLVVLALPFDLGGVDWQWMAWALVRGGIGVAVLVAFRFALRATGSTRYPWRRGTYSQWQQYRRV